MTNGRLIHARSLTIAITLASALALGGCASEPVASSPTESARAASPAGETSTPEPTTPTAEPADEEPATAGLPADFPSNVPIVAGEVVRVEGGSDGGKGEWVVFLDVDDISASALAARQQLTDAGFAEQNWHADARVSKGVFRSADHGVVLTGVERPNYREFMYKVFTID